MDREIAKSIVDIATSIDSKIGDMFLLSEKISDEKSRISFNKSIENLMGFIAHEIIFPIWKEFPDLNPHKKL